MENLEYIDSYFQGLLPPEEKDRFEKRLIEDPLFADEVAFYLSVQKVAREKILADKKQRFRELYRQNPPQKAIVSPMKRTWMYAAAAVLIFAVAGIYFLTQAPSSQQLADQYIKDNFQTLGVTMGSSEDSMQAGLRLFNQGRLLEAAQTFENIIRLDSANSSAIKYAGITYLRLNNYEKALVYFNQLDKFTELRSNPSKLYMALVLMKRDKPGDKEEAKNLLRVTVQQNQEGKQTAEKLLEQL